MTVFKKLLAVLALLLCVSAAVQAEAPSDYAFMILESDQDKKEDCTLREKGWVLLENPILIEGKRLDESCYVKLDAKSFSKKFQMCSLVGNGASNTAISDCNFSTADSGRTVEFIANPGWIRFRSDLPATASCMWACKRQIAKK